MVSGLGARAYVEGSGATYVDFDELVVGARAAVYDEDADEAEDEEVVSTTEVVAAGLVLRTRLDVEVVSGGEGGITEVGQSHLFR